MFFTVYNSLRTMARTKVRMMIKGGSDFGF